MERWSIFEITDGTADNTVSFLGNDAGFHLADWTPTIPEPKGGGVWQSSSLSSGRKKVARFWDNAKDRCTLSVNQANMDALIRDTQRLRRLFLRGDDYTITDWMNSPVYIKARGGNETNTRYTLILGWEAPNDANPYASPFFNADFACSIEKFDVSMEHDHWQHTVPGTGEAVPISVMSTYDGRNLGNVNSAEVREPTTNPEVYIANKHNVANLTHIFHRTGAGAWSANLMDAVVPFSLFPAAAGGALDDVVFFGIEDPDAANDPGPFCDLVFDIITAQVGYEFTWYYCDAPGAVPIPTAWAALSVQDNTDDNGLMTGEPFNTAGIKSVHWKQPDDWLNTGVVNGVTGWWIACEVDLVGTQEPVQQNRDVYTITEPYIEVQENVILGDLPAKIKTTVWNQSDHDGGANPPILFGNRVIVGLRSVSRGEYFSAYINLASTQNPVDMICTYGIVALVEPDPETPTGYRVSVPAPGAAWSSEVNIGFGTIGNNYYGKYHAYIRGEQLNGAVGDIQIRLRSLLGTGVFGIGASQVTDPPAIFGVIGIGNNPSILDLGTISIPPLETGSPQFDYRVALFVEVLGDAAADCYLYDLILIPVDEWAGDFIDPSRSEILGSRSDYGSFLSLDSVSVPKQNLVPNVIDYSTNEIGNIFESHCVPPMVLQHDSRQRYWFLQIEDLMPSLSYNLSLHEIASIVQVEYTGRYLSMRGNR